MRLSRAIGRADSSQSSAARCQHSLMEMSQGRRLSYIIELTVADLECCATRETLATGGVGVGMGGGVYDGDRWRVARLPEGPVLLVCDSLLRCRSELSWVVGRRPAEWLGPRVRSEDGGSEGRGGDGCPDYIFSWEDAQVSGADMRRAAVGWSRAQHWPPLHQAASRQGPNQGMRTEALPARAVPMTAC